MKKQRNYGIDFLRIIAMFCILTSHMLAHGGLPHVATQFSDNLGG